MPKAFEEDLLARVWPNSRAASPGLVIDEVAKGKDFVIGQLLFQKSFYLAKEMQLTKSTAGFMLRKI